MSELRPRDIWVLPLIVVCTLIVALATVEILTRTLWPEQTINGCRVTDPALGYRYLPNCSSRMKAVEGPWYVNDYNECGYRSPTACGAAPEGTRRIALIGTSISEGYLVEYPHTIGATLADDLTKACGSPVETQNLGGVDYAGDRLIDRMKEALLLKPDAVALAVTPFDLERLVRDPETLLERPIAAADGGAHRSVNAYEQLILSLKESRTVTVAQHFLFRNASIYVPLYLRYGDKAGFLHQPFSDAWNKRLRIFDMLLEKLSDLAKHTDTPFVLAFVPQQAQFDLMAGAPAPSGVDPWALPKLIGRFAEEHGISYVDASKALLPAASAELYYRADGHPSGIAQPLIAHALADGLTRYPHGRFGNCRLNLYTPAAAAP